MNEMHESAAAARSEKWCLLEESPIFIYTFRKAMVLAFEAQTNLRKIKTLSPVGGSRIQLPRPEK
jgi:hypothetical protein